MAVATRQRTKTGKRVSQDDDTSSSNLEQALAVTGKKRRLAIGETSPPGPTTTTTKKSVRFDSNRDEIHLVDKIATKYNQRYLWYNKLELTRLCAFEVQHNLRCLDTSTGSSMVDNDNGANNDLTWRGLEYCRPSSNNVNNNDTNNKRANSRVIVQEYWEQLWISNSCDFEALGYLSEALSKKDRERAYRQGLQDAVAAIASSKDSTTMTKNQQQRIGSGSSSIVVMRKKDVVSIFGLRSASFFNLKGNGPVVCVIGAYLLWMLRAMMFCIFLCSGVLVK